jgi:ribosomal protein S17
MMMTEIPKEIPTRARRKVRIGKVVSNKMVAGIGDTVKIMETRPISARKRWRLVEIIEKAK